MESDSLTLKDFFDAFEEASAFGLKVHYMYKGRTFKVDYILSLSCLQIHSREILDDDFARARSQDLSPHQIKFSSPTPKLQTTVSPIQEVPTTASVKTKDRFYVF